MLLSIRHTTQYHYAEPALRVTQALRLWPAPCTGQRVRDWRVEVDGCRLPTSTSDGFGNPVATHTADGAVTGVRIDVRGQISTQDRHGVLGDREEWLPPEFFLYQTPLTAIDDAIRELAGQVPETADGDITRLHALCNLVRDRVDYVPEQTDAETAAAEALAHGSGVCQDHAHLLAACARTLGYPARYVSGYLCAGAGGDAASHAWAEIHVDDIGWVGFDAANRICPNEYYVRIASGRDYHDAAPVRGVHQGGMTETLEVSVDISEAQVSQ